MVLAVFAGLPGVGKSTLAEQVGTALPAAVLAVDTVDFTMRGYDVTEARPGYAAYGVVAALAETQLRMGHHVIIDAVNPVQAARQLWVELAERLDVPCGSSRWSAATTPSTAAASSAVMPPAPTTASRTGCACWNARPSGSRTSGPGWSWTRTWPRTRSAPSSTT